MFVKFNKKVMAPAGEAGEAGGGSNLTGAAAFEERKRQKLSAERENQAPAGPDPDDQDDNGTPSEDLESGEELENDGQLDDGEYEDDDDSAGDLEDEAPDSDEDADSDEDEAVDWKQRFEDTQAAFTELSQERAEIEQQYGEMSSETLQYRFQLEDALAEVEQRAEFLRNTMAGNAQQYQNINWSQVPSDKVAEVQQAQQRALAMQQQAEQMFEQVQAQVKAQKDTVAKREAAIAKVRLARTIPGWGDKDQNPYGKIREFAVARGMDVNEFNRITNPVLIEALHAQMGIEESKKTVSRKRKRKPKAPRQRRGRQQERNPQGQFTKAQKDYAKNPTREGHENMMLAKLKRERKGR